MADYRQWERDLIATAEEFVSWLRAQGHCTGGVDCDGIGTLRFACKDGYYLRIYDESTNASYYFEVYDEQFRLPLSEQLARHKAMVDETDRLRAAALATGVLFRTQMTYMFQGLAYDHVGPCVECSAPAPHHHDSCPLEGQEQYDDA